MYGQHVAQPAVHPSVKPPVIANERFQTCILRFRVNVKGHMAWIKMLTSALVFEPPITQTHADPRSNTPPRKNSRGRTTKAEKGPPAGKALEDSLSCLLSNYTFSTRLLNSPCSHNRPVCLADRFALASLPLLAKSASITRTSCLITRTPGMWVLLTKTMTMLEP